jgi:hypothetical protein
MGYGMGRAKAVAGTPQEKEWLAIGLGGAIFLHGAYDFFLTFDMDTVAPLLFLAIMLGGWILAYAVMRKSLAYSPFTNCSQCRQVIPQMASFCPFCGKKHSIALTCWHCGVVVSKWTRRCSRCSVRMKFPWNLQSRRINDLYHNRSFSSCRSCEEEIPEGTGYCLHCGGEVKRGKLS